MDLEILSHLHLQKDQKDLTIADSKLFVVLLKVQSLT